MSSPPLAERMRPQILDDFVGQEKLIGEKGIVGALLRSLKKNPTQNFPSMILWGPPGVGKTTLARLISKTVDAEFVMFSAIMSGVKEARQIIEDARLRSKHEGRRTLLFVDEIHRFSKSQQDVFLPAVEDGSLSLLGATTENPSFELNSALLSRARVVVLEALDEADLLKLLKRALTDKINGFGKEEIEVDPEALQFLVTYSGGDARTALNFLEIAIAAGEGNSKSRVRHLSLDDAKRAAARTHILYDAGGEEHYNVLSAFHKSLRHSDPQAALYYLARMLEGGEEVMTIVRRLMRVATEDIGLADPEALKQVAAAKIAVDVQGLPECDLALAQATVYLASAAKSNNLYTAMSLAKAEVRQSGPLPIPLHYRNAPTQLMKNLGYGAGYEYDHNLPDKVSAQEALPEKIKGKVFFQPSEWGFEKEIKKRMDFFMKARHKIKNEP